MYSYEIIISLATTIWFLMLAYYLKEGRKQDLSFWKKSIKHELVTHTGTLGTLSSWMGLNLQQLQRQIKITGSTWRAEYVILYRILSLVVGLALAIVLALVFVNKIYAFILAFASLFAYFIPQMQLFFAARDKQEDIRRELADFVDCVVAMMESGISSPQKAMQRTAYAFQNTTSEQILIALNKATVEGFAAGMRELEKIESPELSKLARVLIVSSQKGTQVTTILREFSTDMRYEQAQRVESQIQSRSVTLLLISFVLIVIPTMVVTMIPMFWGVDLSGMMNLL